MTTLPKPARTPLMLSLFIFTLTAFAADERTSEEKLIDEIWDLAAVEASLEAAKYAMTTPLNVSRKLDESIRRSLEFKIQVAAQEAMKPVELNFRAKLKGMSEKDLKQVVKHLKGPVGKAQRNQAKNSNRGPREIQMELARRLPRLLTQTKKIEAISIMLENHYQPAIEAQWQLFTAVPSLVAHVIYAYKEKEQVPTHITTELLDELEAKKPAILLTLNQTMVYSSLYTFRNVSSRAIKKADKFYYSDAGAQFLEAVQTTEYTFLSYLIESIMESVNEELLLLKRPDRASYAELSLQNIETGSCLDLPESLPFSGLTAIQWVCNGTSAQWLDLTDQKLMHLNNNTCLLAYEDTSTGEGTLILVQGRCDDSPALKFTDRPRGESGSHIDIYHAATDKCVTVMGSAEKDGTPLRLEECAVDDNRQAFKRISKQI